MYLITLLGFVGGQSWAIEYSLPAQHQPIKNEIGWVELGLHPLKIYCVSETHHNHAVYGCESSAKQSLLIG